jgi:hypothetical protein
MSSGTLVERGQDVEPLVGRRRVGTFRRNVPDIRHEGEKEAGFLHGYEGRLGEPSLPRDVQKPVIGQPNVRPSLAFFDQSGTDRISEDVVGFFARTLIMPKPVIKKSRCHGMLRCRFVHRFQLRTALGSPA